ncbi:hypothetical protein HDF16_005249 [Granulicella aggregans]|uniref:Uncharacterized protein n=1 Tax=Granulicella aggregans TaxID=474949 RepID=A0A7W8E5U2_9BACT|nr:hypothetical protein [Granulicella aggregans]MBB5060513.1 hypothetical protein [Granulicella aggregans]
MTENIIAALDEEIASLQKARSILAGLSAPAPQAATPTGRRGRPKGSKNATKSVAVTTPVTKKRVLSEEGRARISAALKKRHAAKRKAAKKAAGEQSAN